jgi:hypothetical protein
VIDFETELRPQLDRAADGAPAGDDLLALIERRIASGDRRRTALKVAAVALVVLGGVGAAVGIAGRDQGATTIATDPDTPTSTTAPPPPGTAPVVGWAPMAASPIATRNQFLALDMDGEVLVWGGYDLVSGEPLTDGAVYRTASDTWVPVAAGPLDHGGGPVAAWTGDEAIVLVEDHDSESPTDGEGQAAAYDPATDTWRRLADPPADLALGDAVTKVLWTGSDVVVIDGEGGGSASAIATYDPATDTWTDGADPDVAVPDGDAVWTGSEVVVVGRVNGPLEGPDAAPNAAAAYDPGADAWREIPWGLDGGPRDELTVAWTGDRVFVGGGYQVGAPTADAALLDPATGGWTAVPDAPHPFEGNWRGPETWTGTEVLTLTSPDGLGSTAQLFDPATGTWRVDETPSGLLSNPEAPWVPSAGRVVFPLADGTTSGVSYQP